MLLVVSIALLGIVVLASDNCISETAVIASNKVYACDSGFKNDVHGFGFTNFYSYITNYSYCSGLAYIAMVDYNFNNNNNQNAVDIDISKIIKSVSSNSIECIKFLDDGSKTRVAVDYEINQFSDKFENGKSLYSNLFDGKLHDFSLAYADGQSEEIQWNLIHSSKETGYIEDSVLDEFARFIAYQWSYAEGLFPGGRSEYQAMGLESLCDYLSSSKIGYVTMKCSKVENGNPVTVGHALNIKGIKVDEEDPNKFYLYVYDTNCPTVDDRYITLVLDDNGNFVSFEYYGKPNNDGTCFTSDNSVVEHYWFNIYGLDNSENGVEPVLFFNASDI